MSLPEGVKDNIVRLGNLGISKATWSTYRTAERMWLKCQRDRGLKFELPAVLEDVLIFIDFLTAGRGLSGATVDSYLAGLRQLHVSRGIEPPKALHCDLVSLVIRGKKNEDAIRKRREGAKKRVAITESIMLVLKDRIRRWEKPAADKLLIWTVCTVAFAGAFRIHEILCKLESSFDPDFELCGRDIQEHDDAISFTLKCPKEQKTAAPTVVDVFRNNGQLCPIAAYKKWRKTMGVQRDLPVFRWSDGHPVTGSKLNKLLTTLLADELSTASGTVTTHSFRSGIASMMAQKGFSSDDIKAIGRWSSRAYEVYIKHPRTKRAEMAHALLGRQ
jgi:hypothetical protein